MANDMFIRKKGGSLKYDRINYDEMALAIASRDGVQTSDIRDSFRNLSDPSQRNRFSHALIGALVKLYRDCNRDDLIRYTNRVGRYFAYRTDKQMAYDPLTGLLRKEAFNEELEREKDRIRITLEKMASDDYEQRSGELMTAPALTAVMIDVDNFKKYNDTYGHSQGDNALRKVGEVIIDSIRSTDIAGRVGGEEFSVLLTDADPKSAEEVISRIYNNIRDALVPVEQDADKSEGGTYQLAPDKLTVSVGFASYPGKVTGETLDSILRYADDALYVAKRNGRDQVVEYGSSS